MPFDWNDPYVMVPVVVKQVRDKSIKVESEMKTIHWLPRSCLHGACDRKIEASPDEQQITVRRWLANREGLI